MISMQPPVDISRSGVDGSISSYKFIYNDGSVSPPTFVVPSANCRSGVCKHVFNTPTSSVPPFYTVLVIAANVVGEGPAVISQPIREQCFFTEMLSNSLQSSYRVYICACFLCRVCILGYRVTIICVMCL